jgi:protein O-GlcNAc transferase
MAVKPEQSLIDQALELHRLGKYAEAEAVYRQILTDHPNHPDANHLLGVIAYQHGRHEIALALIQKAIAANDTMAEYHRNLGLVLVGLGRVEEAAAAYERALARRPNYPKALHNLATVQRMQKKIDEAMVNCQKALTYQQNYPEAWNSLGAMLFHKGNLDQAIAAYRQAIHHNPKYPQAYFNLGIALQHQDKMAEAIESYRKAVEIRPDYPEAQTNLGVVLKLTGRLDEAIPCYRAAMEYQPSNTIAHSNLIYLLEFHAGETQQSIFAEQQRYAKQHAEPLRSVIKPHTNDRSPDRRLRIGYLSADLRNHVVGTNLLPLLREHNHEQFEIFCYPSVEKEDAMGQRLHSFSDSWRDIYSLSDQAAAEMVRQDKIDILLDLTLHMGDNRLLVFARKPAPIQVSYLGYCGGTGLDTIDYRISDPQMDPPDAPGEPTPSDLSCYSEKTIRLPNSYWCYQPPDPSPQRVDPPCLKAGFITFGCLNNFAKVSAPAQDLWADILKSVANSRLLIHALPGPHMGMLLERFSARGVAAERVEFVPRQNFRDYLRCYNRIDIALDPFPYGGGITSCDSLWMGLPLVTLCGHTAVGRGGRSILHNIGRPEWVAKSHGEYLKIAVDLAADPARLQQLRMNMREQMLTSPLMNAKQFARDVEAAYRQMWKAYTSGIR